MSLWLIPLLVVVVVGIILVTISAMRAAEEAGRLGAQLRQMGQLRPALVEVRTAGQILGASLQGKSRT
ncbi:MAG: hypothetical protein M3378_12185 [Actinomycetota bacterium]|nr:hypothetical protein [Actinomycetota bacterium]